MFAKLLKIIALGLGAVITTGIPSGTISTSAGQHAAVTMTEPYKLQNQDQVWQQGAEREIEYRSPVAGDLVGYGTSQQTSEADEAPEPQDTAPQGLGDLMPKRDDKPEQAVTPLVFPVSRVSIATPVPPVSRWVGGGPATQYDGCGAPIGSGGLYQPPAADARRGASASYEWCLGGLDKSFMGQWPLFLKLCEDQNPSGGGNPPAPSTTGTTVVPEPTGFLAILAGLPGLTVITRRRKRRIA